jgi:hypothetical protein
MRRPDHTGVVTRTAHGGPLVCLAVVATANHYVFDIAAGLLVSVAGFLVGPLAARALHTRLASPSSSTLRPASAGSRPASSPSLRPELA